MINILNKHRKSGSGYLLIIVFSAILMILFFAFGTFEAGHANLQSKDVRRFTAINLGESALNCIIAEMNANRSYNTHRYYSEKDWWRTPVKKRETQLGEIPGLTLDGVKNGLYTGHTDTGEFKARFALYYSGFENRKTKTLKEGQMYAVAEIAVKSGYGDKHVTCRKIHSFIERRYPSSEHLLYDGELLDLGGLGPFVNRRENILKNCRLYGQHYINFSSGGGSCRGNRLVDVEKVETPGFIKAYMNTDVGFYNKTSLRLSDSNDSSNVEKFDFKDGCFVDGAHGAHPIKFKRLPKERIYKAAKRSNGLILKSNTIRAGKYKNPYNRKDNYVDLDFGEYKCVAKNKYNKSSKSSELDEDDEKIGNGSATYSDDPEPIRNLKGEKVIVYAEVPLRIWGCPDRDITIYSTEDIVIAGDFNQNPITSQAYVSKDYIDYKRGVHNGFSYRGTPGNKMGALIMSEKRVFIDMSRPTLFAKNEIKPFFLWCLAKNLHPSTDKIAKETKEILCPENPSSRGALVGLGREGANGDREPFYGTIAWLCKNPTLNGGGIYNSNMEDIENFFTPGEGERFGIENQEERIAIIEDLKTYLRSGGDLTVDEQDKIFERAWKQACIEEEKNLDKKKGAAGIIRALFKEAEKEEGDGIFIPEITINAGIITGTRRASSWKSGNSKDKAEDEIGNKVPNNYMEKPGFIIQRVYGGWTRLGMNEPDYFVNGSHAGECILRRRVWDNTNLTSSEFKPLEVPAVHNLLTFHGESISLNEYEKFGTSSEKH